MVRINGKIEIPVFLYFYVAIRKNHEMTGQQFVDIFEQRFPPKAELKGKIIVEAFGVVFRHNPSRFEQGFNFGGESETTVVKGVIKWFYAETIARGEKKLFSCIPYREGIHTVEMCYAFKTLIFIKVNNNL